MPNTLVHIGINATLTKSFLKKSDILWILLGCIVPDLPWITRKIVSIIFPFIDGFSLQEYVIVQASLFFCIIISLTFSIFSKQILKTFLILFIGSFLHLLLDALQIKWANGVHLFAPFSWELSHFGIFWPENYFNYFLTIFGLVYIISSWKELKASNPKLVFSKIRILFAGIFGILYLLLPFVFISNVENEDNHYVKTLKYYDVRIGKTVEMDRKKIKYNDKTNSYWIETFNKDWIELADIENINSSKISIKGKFIGSNLIKVTDYHENWSFFRDGSSYLGVTIILMSWITIFLGKQKIIFFGKSNNTYD